MRCQVGTVQLGIQKVSLRWRFASAPPWAWDNHVQILRNKRVHAEGKSSTESDLPALYVQHLEYQRMKRIGFSLSAIMFFAAAFAAVKADMLEYSSLTGVAAAWLILVTGRDAFVLLGGLVAYAFLWVQHNGQVHFEWHDHQFWLETGVPPVSNDAARALEPGKIQVKSTNSARGNGAFACVDIPRGTYIGEYEGDLLDLCSFYARYPNGVGDYCMSIDAEWCLDGRERSRDTSVASACHINHSSQRFNVARRTRRAQRRVELFTTRDVRAGEELLLDYGKQYWKGREDQELP